MPSSMQTLEDKIFVAKKKGLTDKQIGELFNVNLRFIEKTITKKLGINVSSTARTKYINSIFPRNFTPEQTTVWSFKSRGNWATHNGNYRGNWSPYIPRNVILRYSAEGETVLDCFCGSGATGVESKLLNRNFIGVDINPHAIELTKENMNFPINGSLTKEITNPKSILKVGDARQMPFIGSGTVDLICTHPPYSDIIHYTDNQKEDLSFCNPPDFLREMKKVAEENYRVLKNGGYCAVLIGDMRKNKSVIPLGFWLIEVYLKSGFSLQELVIKRQHNCKTTGFWYENSIKYNFLLLAHEYLAIFKKDVQTEPKIFTQNSEIKEFLPTPVEKQNLESTTVWIFDNDAWYEKTLGNLITRYDGKRYILITEARQLKQSNEKYELIVWDTRNTPAINLENAGDITDHLESGGYLSILCQDMHKEDNALFPSAINVEENLANIQQLKIKEIIVISIENGPQIKEKNQNLTIAHKYLLIFQKTT